MFRLCVSIKNYLTARIIALTPFVVLSDKWQFKGWISHLVHRLHMCTGTNSEHRCLLLVFVTVINWEMAYMGAKCHYHDCKLSDKIGVWVFEAPQHITWYKGSQASACISIKYLRVLIGEKYVPVCTLIIKTSSQVVFHLVIDLHIWRKHVQGHEKCHDP